MNDFGIIINFFIGLAGKLWLFYENSALAKITRGIASTFNNLLKESKIYTAFLSESRLNASWENSYICRFCTWLLKIPIRLAGFVWGKLRKTFAESSIIDVMAQSLFGRIIIYIIDRYEIILGGSILLIAIVNHKYWNNFYSTILVLILLALFYVRAIRNKYQGFGIKYLDFSVFAFMFVIIAVQITGIFPKDSFKYFIFYLTSFLFILIIVAAMRTSKALNTMVEVLLMGITVTGLYGIYQRIRGVPTDPSLVDLTINSGMPGRVFSTMQNPNSYAQVLILMLPFFVAVFFNTSKLWKKLFLIGAAVPPLVALLATGSRSAWVALVLAGFVFIFFKERRLIPVFIILGLISIPVIQIVAPSVYLRALTIFNPNDTSVNFRTLIFDTFKPMLKDYWFSGIGLGTGDKNKTFMKLIQNYSLILVNPYGGTEYIPPHTHNLYYQIWIEAGIFGIVSFLWMIIRLFRQSIIAIHNNFDKKAVNLIIAGISGLTGCLIIGTKEYIWFYPRTMIFFFINLGIIYAAIAIVKKKKETFVEN